MRADAVLSRIREHEAELRVRGVIGLALVGSTARGDERPESDVDVLVDVEPGRKFSLVDLSGVRLLLSDALGRDSDVMIREDLRPELRTRLETDAIAAF